MKTFDVHGISVQDVTGVNGAFQPTAQKRVTFYVGTSGPFFLTYDLKDYAADTVLADIQKEVDTLKSIGAIEGA
jgi:hypothetical protein